MRREARLDFSDIDRILELMREHDLAEFELERDGLKLRVRKGGASPTFHATPMHMIPVPAPQALPSAVAAPPAPASMAPAAMAAETEIQAACMQDRNFREAYEAFKAKRRPDFTKSQTAPAVSQ